MTQQTWLITATTGGLGLALAKHLLDKGEYVAGTSRSKARLESILGKESEHWLPLELDFTSDLQAHSKAIIAQVYEKFGRLDNLVNNAGYGLLGFVEEVGIEELKRQFEVNVYAPYILTQEALKRLRPQALADKMATKTSEAQAQNLDTQNLNAQSHDLPKDPPQDSHTDSIKARIYNISSVGGYRVSALSTPYCMSKFALTALSEGLALDLAPFGIAVVNVMPTGFRTAFLGESARFGTQALSDYDAPRAEFQNLWANYNGKQPGDPAGFARAIFHTSRLEKPPHNLFMGEGAYTAAEQKIAAVQADMRVTREYAGSAIDFDKSGVSAFGGR